MQNHNNDTIKTSDSSLEKYTSHFIWKGSEGLLKVLLWERELETEQKLQHIDLHSYGHNSVSFLFVLGCSTGPWGPSLAGTCSHSSIFSPTGLISNWLNFLCTELYNCSTPTFFLCASQITLIQPVHGQGYILIFLGWMHLLFTQVYFLFWQLGQGQYVTIVLVICLSKQIKN